MWSRPPTGHIEQLAQLPTTTPLGDTRQPTLQSPGYE